MNDSLKKNQFCWFGSAHKFFSLPLGFVVIFLGLTEPKKLKMKISSLILALGLFNLALNAQAPDFVWARQMGGSLDQTPVSIKLDGNGNICTYGYFEGTVDFDPGTGTYTLAAPANGKAAYISKLDPQGNFMWAKQISGDIQMGPSQVHAGSMALSTNGDIHVTGFFSGLVDFDPSAGTNLMFSNATNGNTFILKLNSQGNLTWARKLTSQEMDWGTAIAVDALDNVLVTGFFSDTMDVDPGIPTVTLAATNGGIEAYVLKLDPSGNFVWARSLVSANASGGNGIAVDGSGNVITTGNYRGVTDFDSNAFSFTMISAGGQDGYVWKLDPQGNFMWAKRIGGTTDDGGIDIAADNTGALAVSGFFTGTADLDPGTSTFSATSGGNNDVFILKLDPQGNFLWAHAFGGTGNEVASGLAFGPGNDIYATGQFENTVDFDPSPATHTFSANVQDVFIARWTSSGVVKWVKQLQGAAMSAGSAITVDAATNIFSTGLFNGTVDFDGNSGVSNMTSMGVSDVYVHKMKCGIAPQLTLSTTASTICAGNSATLSASGATSYSWNAAQSTNSIIVTPTANTIYTLTASDDNGCMAEASITQNISSCTGIQSHANDESVFVYPNPVSDHFTVDLGTLTTETLTLRLMNAQGKIILDQKAGSPSETISTAELIPGLYFLDIRTETEGSFMRKIVVPGNR